MKKTAFYPFAMTILFGFTFGTLARADVPPLDHLVVCDMTDTATSPRLRFIVRVIEGAEQASMTYQSMDNGNGEEFGPESPIPGCSDDDVTVTEITRAHLYIECAGERNPINLSAELGNSPAELTGQMKFPRRGVEGYNGVELPVRCQVF